MIHVIAAACSTGSWQQKWSCGWHQPNTAAYKAGFAFGHSAGLWVLIGIVVGLVIIARRRGHRAVAAAQGRK